MTVCIWKNMKKVKTFKKYIPCYSQQLAEKWVDEKFEGICYRYVDRGSNKIHIFYGYYKYEELPWVANK